MGSDPEPKYAILYFKPQCTVVKTNSCGPEGFSLLEVQRRVVRIGFQLSERSIRQTLNT